MEQPVEQSRKQGKLLKGFKLKQSGSLELQLPHSYANNLTVPSQPLPDQIDATCLSGLQLRNAAIRLVGSKTVCIKIHLCFHFFLVNMEVNTPS